MTYDKQNTEVEVKQTTMTKTLKWRLSKLPTPSELTELVSNKIITPEEAKVILVQEQNDTERDIDSFKEEIKFLRGLVDDLSKNRVTEVTKYIQSSPIVIEKHYPWTQPYYTWSSSGSNTQLLSTAGSNTLTNGQTGIVNCSFNSIETF